MQIEPLVFTDAERESYYRDLLSQLASELEVSDPPGVQRQGWTQSRAEYGDRAAECLQEAGVPGGQRRWGRAFFLCSIF